MKNYFVYEDTDEMICVVKVETLDDYLLQVYFSNGKIKIFDVKPLLEKRMFKPLKNKTLFSAAKVEDSTVSWTYHKYELGEIDIAPEMLYWDSR